MALARGTSASRTTFGIAAADAGSNGAWTRDESPSRKTSARGCVVVPAIASDTAAAAMSAPRRTLRRSKRSPIQPASGAATTDATTLEKIAAEIHSADPVPP
jgi:hypothetical protein